MPRMCVYFRPPPRAAVSAVESRSLPAHPTYRSMLPTSCTTSRAIFVFMDDDQTFSESTRVAFRLHGFMVSLDQICGSKLRSGFANTDNQRFYIQLNAEVALLSRFPGRVISRVDSWVNPGDWIYPIRSGSGSESSLRPKHAAPQFFRRAKMRTPLSLVRSSRQLEDSRP